MRSGLVEVTVSGPETSHIVKSLDRATSSTATLATRTRDAIGLEAKETIGAFAMKVIREMEETATLLIRAGPTTVSPATNTHTAKWDIRTDASATMATRGMACTIVAVKTTAEHTSIVGAMNTLTV